MRNESAANQVEATPDLDEAWKEYQILDAAVAAADRAGWALTGIFMAGLLAASALLIPKVPRQGGELHPCGYLLASFITVLCSWFWFFGIQLQFRAICLSRYQRLQELEQCLPLKAHTRIHYLYEPKGEQPEWYEELLGRLGLLRPWRGGTHRWLFFILLTITLAHVVTWAATVCPYARSFLQQCLAGSTP